jgi:hypothetical protein
MEHLSFPEHKTGYNNQTTGNLQDDVTSKTFYPEGGFKKEKVSTDRSQALRRFNYNWSDPPFFRHFDCVCAELLSRMFYYFILSLHI